MNAALPLAWTQIWQTAAVAIAVAILVRLFGRRRPHLAYLLVVLAKSLTPPLWSSPAGVFSWATLARSAPSTVELRPATAGREGSPIDFKNLRLRELP